MRIFLLIAGLIVGISLTWIILRVVRQEPNRFFQNPTPNTQLIPPSSSLESVFTFDQTTPTEVDPTRLLAAQPTLISTITPHVIPIDLYAGADITELKQYMLALINADRQTNGLGPVVLNEFASQVGQKHAEEMAVNNYLAHWNLAGQGPDIRYALAGGTDVNMENVYSYYQRYDDGSPVPVADWKKLVFDAEQSLMESPGHRKNILDPDHTHVGIGLAYAPDTGEFRIAQEFVNRYVEIEPAKKEVSSGDTLSIKGKLLPGATEPMVNLLYEPFPSPLTVGQLNQTSTYESPAAFLEASQPTIDDQGTFRIDIPIWPGAKPGFYHVIVWVMAGGQQVAAADILISLSS